MKQTMYTVLNLDTGRLMEDQDSSGVLMFPTLRLARKFAKLCGDKTEIVPYVVSPAKV